MKCPSTMSLVPSPLPFPFPFFLLHFFPFLSVLLFPLSCALALSSPLSLVPLLAIPLSFSFSFSLFSFSISSLPPPRRSFSSLPIALVLTVPLVWALFPFQEVVAQTGFPHSLVHALDSRTNHWAWSDSVLLGLEAPALEPLKAFL